MSTAQTEIAIPDFQIVTDDAGLTLESKNEITLAFTPFAVQAQDWQAKAALITDPKQARIARLEIKTIRTAAEKVRKALKEDSLNKGRAIDGASKKLLEILEPLEARLDEVEKAEERRLAAEREKLVQERCEALRPFVDAALPLPSNLADLTPEQFATTMADAKLLHETKQEAIRKQEEADRITREKVEEERKAREAAELAERERIKAENEKLRKEAEEREAAAKIEREAAENARLAAEAKAKAEKEALEAAARREREKLEAEQKAAAEIARAEKAKADAALAEARKEKEEAERKEREAREKQEREEKERRDAEEARQKEEAAAVAKAAKAPDKDKVKAHAKALASVTLGEMKTAEGKALAGKIAEQMGKFTAWLEKEAENL